MIGEQRNPGSDPTYYRRYAAACEEMRRANVRHWDAEPPFVRVARSLGFKPRPPYYLPFTRAAWAFGLYFVRVWPAVMYLIAWRHQESPLLADCLGTFVASLIFGLGMAAKYKWVRDKRSLSSWEDLG